MKRVNGNNDSLNINKFLFLYFVFTFIFSWLCWIISFSQKSTEFVLDNSWLIAQMGVFAPSITAIIFSCFQNKTTSIKKSFFLLLIFFILIVLGIVLTRYNVKELSTLPFYFGLITIVIALMILIYFFCQSKILYTSQNIKISIISKLKLMLSSWLFYPVVFFVLWLVLSSAFGNIETSIFKKENISIPYLIVFTISFDLLYGGAIGEEIGWRGYALPLLLKKYNPLWASLLLGAVWSLWHLPVDMVAGFGVQGIGGIIIRILTVLPMSVIITWVYLNYKYGMITSILLHAGINIIPAIGFSNYELTFGLLIIVQILICIIIIVGDKSFRDKIIEQT